MVIEIHLATDVHQDKLTWTSFGVWLNEFVENDSGQEFYQRVKTCIPGFALSLFKILITRVQDPLFAQCNHSETTNRA